MKTNILLLFILTVLLSCNTRYAYRSKIKVKDNKPVAETEALAIDAAIEASATQEYTIIDKKIQALEDSAVTIQPIGNSVSCKSLNPGTENPRVNSVLKKQEKKADQNMAGNLKAGKKSAAQVLVTIAVVLLVIGGLCVAISPSAFGITILLFFFAVIFLVAGMIAALINS